jgi:hypothetical protein
MSKEIEKKIIDALDAVENNKGTQTETVENNSAIPEEIENGKLNFKFYFKEGSDDGAVHFDVNFRRGRESKTLKDYTLQNCSELLRILNSAGFLFGEENEGRFDAWIKLQINNEDCFVKKHCNIGWDSIQDEDESIQEIRLQDIYTKEGAIDSEYCGELRDKVGIKGTLESYIEGIKKLVIGNPKLEVALVAGFTGFLTQAMHIEKEDDCNIVFNFTGKSSKGKTTTTKLALTPFGRPQDLMRNFNETQARSEVSMESYGIIPYIMDDKLTGYDVNKRADIKSIVTEIMALSEGNVKRRYGDKKDGKFYCPVLMSTEESIADAISNTTKRGSYYRFLEVECLNDLTKDGEHAEQLDRFMSKNYGLAGEVFAEYLIERYTTESLVDEYMGFVANIRKESCCSHRVAKRKGVILFTAKLVNECLDIGIDIAKLNEMLDKQIDSAFQKSNKTLYVLKELHEYIEKHKKYFTTRKIFNREKFMGIYECDSTNKTKQLTIEPSAFNHIINGGTPSEYFKFIKKDNDNSNVNIGSNEGVKIIKAWKAKGYVLSGGSHGSTFKNTSGRTIDGRQRQVYIIDFTCLDDI